MVILRWFVVSLSLMITTTKAWNGNATSSVVAYKASITEIPGSYSGATGTVVVFVDTIDVGTLGYTGMVSGLQPNLDKFNCTALNGCGVHVHDGTSCETTETQGGHLFVEPVMEDPWVDERYSSHSNGDAWFGGVVNVGDVENITGFPFIIHAEDGSRVGCGILEPISVADNVLTATTEGFGETPSGVTSKVTAVPIGSTVCFYGQASGLEPNLMSWTFDLNATNCTASNGCGVHFHAGYDCSSADTQLGHLYNPDVLGESNDPWALIDYQYTDENGNTKFANCVDTAQEDFVGRAFVIHSNDGSRVSCGIMNESGWSFSNNTDYTSTSGGATLSGSITVSTPSTRSISGLETSGSVLPRGYFVGGGMMIILMTMTSFVI